MRQIPMPMLDVLTRGAMRESLITDTDIAGAEEAETDVPIILRFMGDPEPVPVQVTRNKRVFIVMLLFLNWN